MKITKIKDNVIMGIQCRLYYTNVFKQKKNNLLGEIDFDKSEYRVYTNGFLRGIYKTFNDAEKCLKANI